MNKKEIISYYNDCKIDYRLLWWLDKLWSMHYGFWEKGDISHVRSIIKMNEQVIKHSNIDSNSYIMDAGCGYAGTAMYIANKIKCKIEAITIVEEQVVTSRKIIKRKALDKYINVQTEDFHYTSFKDNTFDLIYAIESVCYADKEKFLKEAYRILKPGGTLLIFDGFNKKEKIEYSTEENNIMKNWNNGWAVETLESSKYFIDKAREVGFSKTEYKNITKNVKKTSKLMYISSFPAYLFDYIGRLFKIRSKYNKGNVIAARYQYIGLKKNLWEYGIFFAQK